LENPLQTVIFSRYMKKAVMSNNVAAGRQTAAFLDCP
jgi:hypothetical protein